MSEKPEQPAAGRESSPVSELVTEMEPSQAGQTGSLQRRARVGVTLLALRSALSQLVVLVGNVHLYRVLTPSDFGVFAIVQFATNFFQIFGDAGLSAALIQQRHEPSHRELSSVWTLQLLIGLLVLLTLGVGAPLVVALWPAMPTSSSWILRCLALGLFLTLVRVVPSLLLERRLQFPRLAAMDFASTIGFYLPAVVLANRGFGALSLGAAIVIQAASVTMLAFVMQPWRPSFMLDTKLLRPIVKFGVSYQSKHIFGFLQLAAAPVLAGAKLGQAALGQIGWAQSTAYFPLRLVEIVSRIGFPLYSRLQSDRRGLAEAIEGAIRVCAVGTAFFVSLIFGLGETLVRIVFAEQWLPATNLLYAYSLAILIGFLTPVLMPAIDAAGHPGTNSRLSALSAVLVWTLVPVGAFLAGTVGFVVAYALVVVIGNIVVLFIARRLLPDVRVLTQLRIPLLTAFLVAVPCRLLVVSEVQGPLTLTLAILAMALVFGIVVLLLDRTILADFKRLSRRSDN